MIEHFTNDLIVDFVHGELEPAADARAHAHLLSCTTCTAEVDAERTLREFLRDAAVASEREMPSAIKAAIWEQIRTAKPGPLAALAALLRPVVAIPIAAVLLAGGYFATAATHHGSPTIAASYYLQAHAVQSSQGPLSERSSASRAAVADAYDGGYPATAAYGGAR
jgi:anti-sigma factor RsiW